MIIYEYNNEHYICSIILYDIAINIVIDLYFLVFSPADSGKVDLQWHNMALLRGPVYPL